MLFCDDNDSIGFQEMQLMALADGPKLNGYQLKGSRDAMDEMDGIMHCKADKRGPAESRR